MSMDYILSIAKRMSEEEKTYSEKLKRIGDSIKHPVLKALLLGIAIDSEKHSLLYSALSALMEKRHPLITEEDFQRIREGILDHIRTEAEMVRMTKELAEKTEDPQAKLILMAIHEDEVRHHQLLVDLRDKIAMKETFTESDFWDLVWRDSPWHGTPGG